MFLKNKVSDISDEEFDNIVLPHIKLIDSYLEDKIIPMTVSYHIATGFNSSSLFENTFDIHISSALNMFNFIIKDKTKLKNNIKNILLSKYHMKVVNETPLTIEKINR